MATNRRPAVRPFSIIDNTAGMVLFIDKNWEGCDSLGLNKKSGRFELERKAWCNLFVFYFGVMQ